MTTDSVERIVASLNDDQVVVELGSQQLNENNETYEAFLTKVFGSLEIGRAFSQFARDHAEATLNTCIQAGDHPVTAIGIGIFQGLAIGYRYGRDHVKESDLPL